MNNNEKRIYTCATAHLDTSWLWTLEKTIEDYLPHTLSRNFALFEKYPDYKFNFEGAYRYELIEEYYPELFKKLRKYIADEKWVPCGSSYENGDVNTPSPEALLRNIMYGNRYFKEKFGTACSDIFLPDCFGFGYALPSIASHAGLNGFSTGKLLWGSAYPVPFDIGRWKGVDGNSIYACLLPFSYTTVLSSIRKNPKYLKKLAENLDKYNLPYTFIYHGTGDRGGSPSEFSVRNAVAELSANDKNDIKVLSASTRQFFNDMEKLPQDVQKALPEWNNELLLTEHGAGSYTARTANKRLNRRCEQLADAAERSACAAMCVSGAKYPQYAFDSAWKKVISHHFHDDITGTSFTECYKRSQNDYIQSLNVFSNEYTAACRSISSALDTSFCKGTPVIVSNPVQCSSFRTEAVSALLPVPKAGKYYRVYDNVGNEVFSQNVQKKDGYVTVVFIAGVPSVGMRVYDVRSSAAPCSLLSTLSVTSSMLENGRYRVFINKNGDISDIFDKTLNRSVLSAPIRMCILNDLHSFNYPAWEMKYADITGPVRETPKKPSITIQEFGPARIAIRIERKSKKSAFSQIISLDEGGSTLKVYNEVDWRDTGNMLKVEFPLSAGCTEASYDLGLGIIKRRNNTDKLFEVPAQLWADITDEENGFGVSVLSDSRTGWDKPADNILRLTAIHTPLSNYRWECSQHLLDFGLNRFGFGVFMHNGDFTNGTQEAANNFAQPMNTFISPVHRGKLGTSYSFACVSDSRIIIRAIKKAQDSDNIVIRLNEGNGDRIERAELSLADGILDAFEADGTERFTAGAAVENGRLVFSMAPFEIKTFVLTVRRNARPGVPRETVIDIPCNTTAITSQKNCADAALSIPRELIPDTVYTGEIEFYVNTAENNNAVSCRGQTVIIPEGVKSVHLLVSRQGDGRDTVFMLDDEKLLINIPGANERTGAWDLIALGQTGYINKTPLAFSASHSHSPDGDLIALQYNLYRICINVYGRTVLRLPDDEKIIIIAAAGSKDNLSFRACCEHYDSLEKRDFDYVLSNSEREHASPAGFEGVLDKFIPRRSTKFLDLPSASTAIQPAEVYFAARMIGDKAKLGRIIKNIKKGVLHGKLGDCILTDGRDR